MIESCGESYHTDIRKALGHFAVPHPMIKGQL